MKNLQKQIELDARYLQTLFQQGKYSREITERYEANLELLFEMDLNFLNVEPSLN